MIKTRTSRRPGTPVALSAARLGAVSGGKLYIPLGGDSTAPSNDTSVVTATAGSTVGGRP